ncbi:TetR/AcrR family transcriptional regulator [Pseudomonas sp. NPDC089554]|uniref:TetR/AcrR family transcriptional regulator n=1 Tax=Pseudomonas sp. NPDC089554 TaxID=3390653 RepID=UPI003D08556A
MGRHRQFDEREALEAALKVFWQKGYEGTSFEDLTKATGVARPGLYTAFGNKEALFRKALDLYGTKYVGYMTEALDEPNSLAVVTRMLRECARVQTLHREHPGCLGLNGALACSDNNERIRLVLVERRAVMQLGLCHRLEQARREGDLPGDTDCVALAAYVMVVIQGMGVQAKAGASRKTLNTVVDQVLMTWPGVEQPQARH